MSHITKIMLTIKMKRVRNCIKPEITEEHCGFVEYKGTVNAIKNSEEFDRKKFRSQQRRV